MGRGCSGREDDRERGEHREREWVERGLREEVVREYTIGGTVG